MVMDNARLGTAWTRSDLTPAMADAVHMVKMATITEGARRTAHACHVLVLAHWSAKPKTLALTIRWMTSTVMVCALMLIVATGINSMTKIKMAFVPMLTVAQSTHLMTETVTICAKPKTVVLWIQKMILTVIKFVGMSIPAL
jgi:hypothetical protein